MCTKKKISLKKSYKKHFYKILVLSIKTINRKFKISIINLQITPDSKPIRTLCSTIAMYVFNSYFIISTNNNESVYSSCVRTRTR